MKSLPLIIEEWSQPVFESRDKKIGRPRSDKKVADLKIEILPNNFYLKLAILKNNEIDNFIRKFFLLTPLPFGKHKGQLLTVDDVLDFQNELSLINKYAKGLKRAINNKFVYTSIYLKKITSEKLKSGKIWSLFEVLNMHLSECKIEFSTAQVVAEQLLSMDKESYKNQLDEMSKEENHTGLMRGYDVLNTPEKRVGNMNYLICKPSNIFSWCVLNLLTDQLINNQPLHNCRDCNRIFLAKTNQQRYCEICTPKFRVTQRVRKLRARKK